MKTQPLLEPYRPQNTRRIINKTALVQYPNFLLPQIRQTSELIDQSTPAILIQANGHRVDGKIPAEKIIFKRPRPHLGQSAGMRIKFLPGRDKIQTQAKGPLQRGRAEARIDRYLRARRFGHAS